MGISTVCSSAAIVGTALIAILVPAAASATSQQLDCVLTDTAGQLGSENRPIVISFDEDAKSLKAQEANQNYSFSTVSISNVSISGEDGNISVGIDRSSLGLVWQQFGADKVVTEFGQCRRSNPPAAGESH